MDGRFDCRDGTENAHHFQTNFDQLSTAVPVPGAVYPYATDQPEPVFSPEDLHSISFSASKFALSRGKGDKVTKPGAASRRGSRAASSTPEQLALFAQHTNNPNILGSSTPRLGSSAAADNHFFGTSFLPTTSGGLNNVSGLLADAHQASFHGACAFDASGPQDVYLGEDAHLAGDRSSPKPSWLDTPKSDRPATPRRPVKASNSSTGVSGLSGFTAVDEVMRTHPSAKIDSTLARKLAAETALRQPTQRRGDQKLNIKRRSNVEALLAHVTGTLASHPCKNCRKGHGPWTECVVYAGQMCGSCSNCWYNASGSRCTFHESKNPHPRVRVPSPVQPVVASQQVSVCAPPQADVRHPWVLTDSIKRLVRQSAMETIGLSRGERFRVRIKAAAKELTILRLEYREYLQTPEGRAEEQRGAQQDQLVQQDQQPDIPLDQSSPCDVLG